MIPSWARNDDDRYCNFIVYLSHGYGIETAVVLFQSVNSVPKVFQRMDDRNKTGTSNAYICLLSSAQLFFAKTNLLAQSLDE